MENIVGFEPWLAVRWVRDLRSHSDGWRGTASAAPALTVIPDSCLCRNRHRPLTAWLGRWRNDWWHSGGLYRPQENDDLRHTCLLTHDGLERHRLGLGIVRRPAFPCGRGDRFGMGDRDFNDCRTLAGPSARQGRRADAVWAWPR